MRPNAIFGPGPSSTVSPAPTPTWGDRFRQTTSVVTGAQVEAVVDHAEVDCCGTARADPRPRIARAAKAWQGRAHDGLNACFKRLRNAEPVEWHPGGFARSACGMR